MSLTLFYHGFSRIDQMPCHALMRSTSRAREKTRLLIEISHFDRIAAHPVGSPFGKDQRVISFGEREACLNRFPWRWISRRSVARSVKPVLRATHSNDSEISHPRGSY